MDIMTNTRFNPQIFRSTSNNNQNKSIAIKNQQDTVELKNTQKNDAAQNTPKKLTIGQTIMLLGGAVIAGLALGLLLVKCSEALGKLKDEDIILFSILDDMDLAAHK